MRGNDNHENTKTIFSDMVQNHLNPGNTACKKKGDRGDGRRSGDKKLGEKSPAQISLVPISPIYPRSPFLSPANELCLFLAVVVLAGGLGLASGPAENGSRGRHRADVTLPRALSGARSEGYSWPWAGSRFLRDPGCRRFPGRRSGGWEGSGIPLLRGGQGSQAAHPPPLEGISICWIATVSST